MQVRYYVLPLISRRRYEQFESVQDVLCGNKMRDETEARSKMMMVKGELLASFSLIFHKIPNPFPLGRLAR